MIQMVSIGNWVYLRSRLCCCYQEHIMNCFDGIGGPTFRAFVEDVYCKVLKWNQYSNSETEMDLCLINGDIDLALDLLESIEMEEDPNYRETHRDFRFTYVDSLGAAILETCLFLEEPPKEHTIQTYTRRIQKLRTNKLTKLARLLNVLRESKDR